MEIKDKTKEKIGIIGGGQLGKMMILEAKKMGFYVIILDPTKECPADSIADEHIVADFNDESAIRKLADKSDVLTYEFEHIGVEVLKDLEAEGY
ncbi:MAG: 5-(carboxyamino)imidazole ribonucleotide synthase, partial [Halanaerobium sp. MSAO_Bac5]